MWAAFVVLIGVLFTIKMLWGMATSGNAAGYFFVWLLGAIALVFAWLFVRSVEEDDEGLMNIAQVLGIILAAIVWVVMAVQFFACDI